jgi:hypothetical protein
VLLELKSEGLLMDTPIVSFIIELDAVEQRGRMHEFRGGAGAAECPLAMAISEYKTKAGVVVLLSAYMEEGELEYEAEVERKAKAEAAEKAAEEARVEGEARAQGKVDAARKDVARMKITGALRNAAANTKAEKEQQRVVEAGKAEAEEEKQRAKKEAEKVTLAADEVQKKIEEDKKMADEEMQKMKIEAEKMKNDAERDKKQARIHLQSAAMAASEAEREADEQVQQHQQELDAQRDMIIARAESEAKSMVKRALEKKDEEEAKYGKPAKKKWTVEQVNADFQGWIEAQVPAVGTGAEATGCYAKMDDLGYDELDSLQDLLDTDGEGAFATKFGITAEHAKQLVKALKTLKLQGYMEVAPTGGVHTCAAAGGGGGGGETKGEGGAETAPIGSLLKDDEEYQKYFKMMKMGLPKGAAQNAMAKDGKDPAILDLDPEKPLPAAFGKPGLKVDTIKPAQPALKDDEEYQKYFKMMKMGLPKGAAQNSMVKDGKDPAILDLDPEKPLPAKYCEKAKPNSPKGFLTDLKSRGGGGGNPMAGLLGGLQGAKLKKPKPKEKHERSASEGGGAGGEDGTHDGTHDIVSMIKNGVKLKKVDRSAEAASRSRSNSGDNTNDIVSLIKNGVKLKSAKDRPVKEHRRVQSEPLDMLSELRKKLKNRSPENGSRNLVAEEMTRPIMEEDAEESDEPVPEPVVQPVVYDSPTPIHSFAKLTDPAGLPSGVNPLQKDEWLIDGDFEKTFGLGRAEFAKVPKWKRDAQKKEVGLW